MATYGFEYRFTLDGSDPVIQDLLVKDTGTLTKGDLVNLESGEIDLAATGDSALLGTVLETVAGTDSTTRMRVIMNPTAVYGVADANARKVGDTLDISGTTGEMTVAASSNADLVVVAESTAAEETLVMIAHGNHAFN